MLRFDVVMLFSLVISFFFLRSILCFATFCVANWGAASVQVDASRMPLLSVDALKFVLRRCLCIASKGVSLLPYAVLVVLYWCVILIQPQPHICCANSHSCSFWFCWHSPSTSAGLSCVLEVACWLLLPSFLTRSTLARLTFTSFEAKVSGKVSVWYRLLCS